jgi:subtilisin family serine protease
MRRSLAASLALAGIIAAFAVSAGASREAAATAPPDSRTGDIIVRFHDDATLLDVAGALEASETEAIKTTNLTDIALVEPEDGASVDDAIAALESDPNVMYAEPDYRVTIDVVPNDTHYGSQWHYPKIGLPATWDGTTGSSTVIVAVIDTGVELTDAELDSKITTGANAGYDFVNDDTNPTDDHGHGTHVAGTIAAETNNGTGVAGVCWACKIMAVKVLDNTGSGSTLDVAAGIDWARTHGAKVANLSLGSLGSGVTLQNAVNNAYNAGLVVVGAAGNNAGDADTSDDGVMYPGAYANAIAVGATDSSDNRASFSNYGPELDVTAPGVGILSTVMGSGYQSWSGTSMATPHVAGAAGLLASAGITDPAMIRSRLTSTATDLGAGGFDNFYGHGRINVDLAIDVSESNPPSVNITSPAAGATLSGTSVTIAATASDDSSIQKVRFWAGSTYLGYDSTFPYSKSWNTTLGLNGKHTIKAEAVDVYNNTASQQFTVTVINPDSTQPAVNITDPANGATVSGTVAFNASASDTQGLQKVQFWAGSTYLGYDSSAPYTRSWDTTAFVNGTHTLRARAIDWGNNWTETTISVTVNNADSTPPSASITSPLDGATVSGTITINASASDNVGVQKVRFWVDGTYLGYDATAAYSRSWNSASVSNGAHTLRVQAVDNANNVSADFTINVNVSN